MQRGTPVSRRATYARCGTDLGHPHSPLIPGTQVAVTPGGRPPARRRAAADRYVAPVTPQAWVYGHANEVDPAGPQEWDCTEYAQRNQEYLDRLEAHSEPLDTRDGAVDNDDVFAADPAAPQWVRRWHGPFTIRVRRCARRGRRRKTVVDGGIGDRR